MPAQYPAFDEDLLVKLFHKGSKVRWTSEDVDWGESLRLSERQAQALARLLTPVYLGEQTAMLGAASVIPELMEAGHTTAQLYVSSFMLDEARHFEALTRLYQRLDHHPVTLREMPEMLRYHSRLRQTRDRVDWVWGILISDLFAKTFYGIFRDSQPEALFGRMSGKILEDEARHQAFAEHYLRRVVPEMDGARRQALIEMRDELLRVMDAMYRRLREDTDALDIDGVAFFDRLTRDIDLRVRRIGLLDPPATGFDGPAGDGDGGNTPDDRGGTGVHGHFGAASAPDTGTAPGHPQAGVRTASRVQSALAELRRSVAYKWRALRIAQLAPPRIIIPVGSHVRAAGQDDCGSCFLALICRSRLMTATAR